MLCRKIQKYKENTFTSKQSCIRYLKSTIKHNIHNQKK